MREGERESRSWYIMGLRTNESDREEPEGREETGEGARKKEKTDEARRKRKRGGWMEQPQGEQGWFGLLRIQRSFEDGALADMIS